MGELLSEFSDLLAVETTYEEDSAKLIEDAKRFIHNSALHPKCTYQGISVNNICNCIGIGRTELVTWEHVSFTIDLEFIKDINNGKIEVLSIPTFTEEVRSSGKKLSEQFGFNQNIRNNIKTIKIPLCTTVIAPSTFAFFKKLEHIEFEESSRLMYLGDYAFAYCESLNTLDLRECKFLEEISKNTFLNSGIKHLKISSSIRKMYPIRDCELQYITIDKHRYTIDEFNSQLNDAGEVFWYSMDSSGYDF